jgi:hypothetical protein
MEPIRGRVEIDVSQLGNLASASESVASSTQTMAQRFLAAGLSAREAQSALQNLGVSAKAAQAAVAGFSTAAVVAGTSAADAATKVDSMTRAMAAADVRIASSIGGLGGLGSAFARVGAASSTLAPILAAGFPVLLAIAFVDIVERGAEAYEKWVHLGEETVHKLDDQTLSLRAEGDQLDVVNARLQNQIDKLEHKPEDYLAVFLAEDRVRADNLAKSIENVIQKTTDYLKKGTGLGSEVFLGKADEAAVGKILEPLERRLQLADLAGDKQKQFNILLEAQALLEKALNEETNRVARPQTPFGPEGTRGPDPDAINAYQSALAGVSEKLADVGKEDLSAALEAKEAKLKAAADQEAAAKRFQELIDRNKERAIQGAREEAAAVARGIKEWEELETKAQHALEAGFKKNADEAAKDAKASEDAWQAAAQARIKGEEDSFDQTQENAENSMRLAKAAESEKTAGLTKGPITSVIELGSLKEQGAIAAAAMQEARAAAESYAVELEIVKSAMSELNTKSEEGLREYRDLARQMVELERLLRSTTAAGDKWSATIGQIGAKQKELEATLGFSMQNIKTAMENASQAGWNSFNSSFLKMMAGGESFTRTMQTLWTSMVDSFVTAILRMAEYYIEKLIIMAAVTWAFKKLGLTDNASNAGLIASNQAERHSAIGAAAAEAGLSVAAEGPIAVIAATAAVEAAMMGITSLAEGGIVRANLHEGEAVLPAHLTTFLLHSAGAFGAAGGPGGAGGRGGPGGPGGAAGAAGHTFVFNHNGSGDSGDMKKAGKDFMRLATRELRRMNIR